MKNISKTLGIILILSFMINTSSFAQLNEDYRPFRDWDTNNNEKLSHGEFVKGIKSMNLFDAWDENNDGTLERSELHTGIFRKWQKIGQTKNNIYKTRANMWTDYYIGNFDDWDTNKDGTITNQEFNKQINNTKIEEKIDLNKDGKFDEMEFYTAVFRLWDEDRNGMLTDEEYDPDEFESWFY